MAAELGVQGFAITVPAVGGDDAVKERIAWMLCPVEDHNGPCEVPWGFTRAGEGDDAGQRRGIVGGGCEGVAMSERVRVAVVIQRGDRVLMVRERVQTGPGRHDGPEYWTLPGGGIELGEEPALAVRREVLEEVGLEVTAAREVAQVPYPSGMTTVFRVDVADGEPRLGVDDLGCSCPRMVGLEWVEVPPMTSQHGGSPVPLLIYCW